MTPELVIMIISAASVAFLHTLLGPDHYVPFIAMAKARNWSLKKTLRMVLLCGAGHLIGSVALGVLGIAASIELTRLVSIESQREELASWGLCIVGALYCVWGLRHAYRHRTRADSGWHNHGGGSHYHEHLHTGNIHVMPTEAPPTGSITPWAIFVVFVLGPCEPLIPILMFPAATKSVSAIFWVTGVFAVVTVATMLATVAIGQIGIERLRIQTLSRFGHTSAGAAMLGCGIGIGWMRL